MITMFVSSEPPNQLAIDESKQNDNPRYQTFMSINNMSDMTDPKEDDCLIYGWRNTSESSPGNDSMPCDTPVSSSCYKPTYTGEHNNCDNSDTPNVQNSMQRECLVTNGSTVMETSNSDDSSREASESDVIKSTSGDTSVLRNECVAMETTDDLSLANESLIPTETCVEQGGCTQQNVRVIERVVRRGNRVKKIKIRFGENPEVTKLGQLVNKRRKENKEKKKSKTYAGKEPEKNITKDNDGLEEAMACSDLTPPNTCVNAKPATLLPTLPPIPPVVDECLKNVGNESGSGMTIKTAPTKRKKTDNASVGKADRIKRKKKETERLERKREQAKLMKEAREAKREERLRRKWAQARQKELEERYLETNEDDTEPIEHTAGEVTDTQSEDLVGSAKPAAPPIPVLKRYVLDEHSETKEVLVEIDPILLAKLKPHQVEAVRFMYDCCIKSIEQVEEGDAGGGCILAHCMGLGKTLSVISFVYTLMNKMEHTWIGTCLIVCPLNTVKNWVNEFQKWLSDLPFKIQVYELSNIKENSKRGEALKDWRENGGVMILGYEMYRNLVQAGKGKVRVQKETYTDILADPGPELVICDEGHILKNEKSQLYKAMSRIKTKRRVILTGTPLQNNLKEYYHMVNYVKPLLLSTMKNFRMRFIEPITQGQCKDSSPTEMHEMKHRVHVLHRILGGCVQRKDYSALTKFLPPKHEYVISVRMVTKQCSLYEKYLQSTGVDGFRKIHGKNARLFKDYQTLMRIWTHPWLLTQDISKKDSESNANTPKSIDQSNNAVTERSPPTIIDKEIGGGIPDIVEDIEAVANEEDITDSSKTVDHDPPVLTITDELKHNLDVQHDMPPALDAEYSPQHVGLSAASSPNKDFGQSPNQDENEEPINLSFANTSDQAINISDDDDAPPTSVGEIEPDGAVENDVVFSDWWKDYVKDEDLTNMALSGKIMLLFEILDTCRKIGDKLLVFSQSIPCLNLIESFLRERSKLENGGNGQQQSKNTWVKDKDYFRIDGTTNAQKRKDTQKNFNDPTNDRASLFLISTKAGSLGTNLVAANRVIIFDASWNPAHDIQSIFRVYRFGQVKPVFVYRFLAQGTMEEKIYERQVTKQSLSQRVIDEHQIERHFTAADLQALYEFKPDRLDDPDREERPLPNLPKDELLASLMTNQKDLIVTFHEHDSLLENIEEQELTEEEKKAAWDDYERKALHIYKPPEPIAIDVSDENIDKPPEPMAIDVSDENIDSSRDYQEQADALIETSPYTVSQDEQRKAFSNPIQLEDWFNQIENTELLDTVEGLISEKFPEVIMQAYPEYTQHTPYPPVTMSGVSQPMFTGEMSNAASLYPYTDPDGQSNTQPIDMSQTTERLRNQVSDNWYSLPMKVSNSDSYATIPPDTNNIMVDHMHREDVAKDPFSPDIFFNINLNRPSTQNVLNDFTESENTKMPVKSNTLDRLAYPSVAETMPLKLPIITEIKPVNQERVELSRARDLNTPDLVLNSDLVFNDGQDPDSSSESILNTVPHFQRQNTPSPTIKPHFKPKKRYLERLLHERKAQENTPLTISQLSNNEDGSSTDTTANRFQYNTSPLETPITDRVLISTQDQSALDEQNPMIDLTDTFVDTNDPFNGALDGDKDMVSVSTERIEKPLVQNLPEVSPIVSHEDVVGGITNSFNHSSNQHTHLPHRTPTDSSGGNSSSKDHETATENQATNIEATGVDNNLTDVQSANEDHFIGYKPSIDLLPHSIPLTVFDTSALRQHSASSPPSSGFLSFSPVKTDDYDDISDSEES